MSEFEQQLETLLSEKYKTPKPSERFEARKRERHKEDALSRVNASLISSESMPPRDVYDYESAAAAGATLSPEKDGGVNLPNAYAKRGKMTAAGYDVATGQKYLNDFDDPDGYIHSGVQGLRNSRFNTAYGTPVEDAESLAMIAYGEMREGANYDTFAQSVSDNWGGQRAAAWRAAEQAQFRKDYVDGNLDFDVIPDAPEVVINEPYREEDLQANAGWLRDAGVMFEHFEGEPFSGDPTALHQWMVDKFSQMNAPAWGGALMTRAAFAPESVKQAMYRAHTAYINTDNSIVQFGRGLKYNLMDPTTYVGAGAGALAARLGMRVASQNLAKMLAVSMTGAVEGGAYTTLDDFYRQMVDVGGGMQEGYDPEQGAQAGAVGAAGGAVLGAALPPVAEYGGKMIRKGWKAAGPDVMQGVIHGADRFNKGLTGIELPLMQFVMKNEDTLIRAANKMQSGKKLTKKEQKVVDALSENAVD